MALFGTADQGMFGLAAALLVFSCVCLREERRRGAGEKNGGGRPACFSSRLVFFAFLMILGGAAGFFRMEFEEALFAREEAAAGQNPKETCILTGTVLEIGEREGGGRLVLGDCTLAYGGSDGVGRNSMGRDFMGRDSMNQDSVDREKALRNLYCYLDHVSGLGIGQRISVSGTAETAGPARNPGGFDYRLYCRAQGICGIFYGEGEVRILEHRCFPFSEGLRRLRLLFGQRISAIAEEADRGILKAVLLGDKKEIDSDVYELYRRNGVSHLLAISGLHVSVIGLGAWKGLRKCGMGFSGAGILAGVFLLCYGKMIGFGPSVTRAVFMMLLSFLAAAVGRTYDLPSAMCIPAMGILLRSPYALTQPSFQLSFLAAGAVFFPGRILMKAVSGKGRWEGMIQALIVSASIQMMTAPVILYHSFELPVYGVVLNLVVIPLMTYVLVSGIAGLLGSLAGEASGAALLGGAHYILVFYEWICEVFAELPFSSVILGRPFWWQIGGFYLCLFLGVLPAIRERTQKNRKQRGLLGLAAFWIAAFLFLVPVSSGGLFVAFLDVGQGDGIFLEMDGNTMLVDCGSSRERNPGEDCLVPFLKSRGVRVLDTVAVSHGDWDHISGIRYLLENPECGIEIGLLLMPEAGRGEEVYEKLEALAGERKIPVLYMEKNEWIPGMEAGAGKGEMCCLSPPANALCRDRNAESLVLFLKYGNFRMLLTGDMEESGEELLVNEGILCPVTVLKAGHHGSGTSSGEDFVKMTEPQYVVLSYGQGNRYGHPAPEVVERFERIGACIFETAGQGAIQVWTDGKRMKIRGFLK